MKITASLIAAMFGLLINFGCSTPVASKASTKNQSERDANIVKLLPGTWVPDPADREALDGMTIYRADQTGTELIWPTGHPDRAIRVEFSWEVANGRMSMITVVSSNPEIVPVGLKLVERELSISGNDRVYELADGYGSETGKRVRAIKTGPSQPVNPMPAIRTSPL